MTAELVEVWCDKCPEPATARIPLTNGTVANRCAQHAWLIVAPRGHSPRNRVDSRWPGKGPGGTKES